MILQREKYLNPLLFWLMALGFFLFCIYLFQDVLLPFVLGITIAYLLNPAVNAIVRWGVSRRIASLGILLLFFLVAGGLIGIVAPIAYREFVDFYHDLPMYLDKLQALCAPYTKVIEGYIGVADVKNIEGLLKENSAAATNAAQFFLSKLGSGGQAVLGILSVVVFMPVISYFMMKEWPHITQWVNSLIPRHMESTVLDLLNQIDYKISGFVRGQISVAFCLAVGYAIALSLIGLKYGFVIGLGTGLLSIIPMVGSAMGLIVGLAMAWVQTGDITFMVMVAGVFGLGQVIEGNFLTPRLVGQSVGLHPLWIFFALLAGGNLLGILGMFLAVPFAAVTGVLLGFAIRQYKASVYYNNGKSDDVPQKS